MKDVSELGGLASRQAQAHFELALESSRVARTEALQALSDQQDLLNRLFRQPEMKASARGLIVGTTKAIKMLHKTTEEMETVFFSHASLLARDRLNALEDGNRHVKDLAHSYESELAILSAELQVAEVVDKQECQRIQASLQEVLDKERAAAARISEKADLQLAGYEITVRELEEALDVNRAALHAQLEAARSQLRDAEERERQAVAEGQAVKHAHQEQLSEWNRERTAMIEALREANLRAEGFSRTIQELHESHAATESRAARLERQIEQAQEDTEQELEAMQSAVEAKMLDMNRLQAWALASSSARALETRQPRELQSSTRRAFQQLERRGALRENDALLHHLEGWTPRSAAFASSHSAADLLVGSSSDSTFGAPTLRTIPSSRAASRSRGRLYAEYWELARSTSEARLSRGR